jgi:hypothetical protein
MYTMLWSLLLIGALITASVVYHHDREKREANNKLPIAASFTIFSEMSQEDDDAWHEYRRVRRAQSKGGE